MTNGNVDQEELVLYCYKDKEIIRALIQQLQARTDIAGIILTPHWGEEEKFEVARGRELWAHEMIDLGVTAIVGSHPHVIQKIEDYISADGRRTFVAYSMGNFVSNQPWIPTKASMMLFSKFKLNAQKKLEVVDVKALPLWMDRTVEKDATSKFRVVPVYDFAPKPAQAVKIWREQLGEKYLIRAPTELDHFLKK
jgi:poly-gamma-glutamate capsule biosynthesis protein CapA/YwtB (metallophosphatase superfamily)